MVSWEIPELNEGFDWNKFQQAIFEHQRVHHFASWGLLSSQTMPKTWSLFWGYYIRGA